MFYDLQCIAGYESEKEELERLCYILNNREEYQSKGAKLPKGIIFYGETGTGKTLFAKVMASLCGLEVFKISVADVEDEKDVCKIIKKSFKKASSKKEPTMIFFDELDKVLPNYYEDYCTDRAKTILAQLLTSIDGMDSNGNVIFVATCNEYDVIPETLVRPGRIDKKIAIGLPTYSSRVQILDMYMKKSTCRFETSSEEIAKLCIGYSCAGLETLINECILQSDKDGFISHDLIMERYFEIKNEDIPRERSNVDNLIKAYSNVGRFVVSRAFNTGHYILSLDSNSVCNNFFNNIINLNADEEDWSDDYDEDDYDDDEDYDDCNDDKDVELGSIFSKNDYLNTITVLCGGYVTEEVVLHKIYDNVGTSLNIIDTILQTMARNGMFGIELCYTVYRNESILPYTAEHLTKINEVFEKTMAECYKSAKAIIEKNVGLINQLAKILVQRQVIQDDECEKIVQELGGINF